jgi:hypothetical protein
MIPDTNLDLHKDIRKSEIVNIWVKVYSFQTEVIIEILLYYRYSNKHFCHTLLCDDSLFVAEEMYEL